MLPTGEFGAALLEKAAVRFAEWKVAPDGSINATRFDLSCHCCYKGPKFPKLTQRVALTFENPRRFSPSPAIPRHSTETSAVAILSWPAMRAKITMPDRPTATVWLQWYGLETKDQEYAVIRPDEKTGQVWAIVLMQSCRSPEGRWSAPTIGDMDSDGAVDVAFVAHGVGTCGGEATADCPLAWLDISLSGSHGIYSGRMGHVIVRNADVGRLERRIGADLSAESARWSGRIERGRYQATVAGPTSSQVWSVVLRDNLLHVTKNSSDH